MLGMKLGVNTSTYDAEGEVLATAPLPDLTFGVLQQALARFVGDIEQQPPAFSALKIAGVAVPSPSKVRRNLR